MATQKNHYVLSELLPNPKKYDTKGHHRARHAMVLYKLTGSWPSDYSHNRYFGWAWIGSGVMVASCTLNTAKGWNPKYTDGKLKTFMEDLLTTKQLKMLHDNAGELGCDQVHNLTGEGSDIMKLCEDTELILQVDAAIQGELEKAWKEAGVDVEEMKKKNPGSHEAFLGLMGLGDSVKQRKEMKKKNPGSHEAFLGLM